MGLQGYIVAQHVGEKPGSFSVYWAVKADSPIKTVADLILGFDHIEDRAGRRRRDLSDPVATYYGSRMVERTLIWSARAAGTSTFGCTFKVVLPAALPSVLTGFRAERAPTTRR